MLLSSCERSSPSLLFLIIWRKVPLSINPPSPTSLSLGMSAFDSQLSTLSAALGDEQDRTTLVEDQQHDVVGQAQDYEPDWSAVYPQHTAEPEVAAWHDDVNPTAAEATLNDTMHLQADAQAPSADTNDLIDSNLDQAGPPRKKPRKRGSTAKGKTATASIFESGAVTEYEDPSHDFRAGVIYVHAGPTAAQACMRCHAIKRKCDNNRPRCSGCSKSDEPCAYEMNPATTA